MKESGLNQGYGLVHAKDGMTWRDKKQILKKRKREVHTGYLSWSIGLLPSQMT